MSLSFLFALCLFAGAYALPGFLLAALLQLKPVRRLTQRSRLASLVIPATGGLLCLGTIYTGLIWVLACFIYVIAASYFDTTLGLVPGITQANIGQYAPSIILELSLRLGLPVAQSHCFSADARVCQMAGTIGRAGFSPFLSLILITVGSIPALLGMAGDSRRFGHSDAPAA